MGESRRKFDQDFREGAVWLVRETGRTASPGSSPWKSALTGNTVYVSTPLAVEETVAVTIVTTLAGGILGAMPLS